MKQISKKIKIYTSGQNHTKMNITIEFFILKLLWVPVFSWNGHFQFFGLNFLTKGTYFYSKTDKIDIDIEFCTFEVVFVSNLTLNFWTKFTQEKYLCSKTEKVNIIIEFQVFKLVLVPNFSLNWLFWFFWPDLPKKSFCGLKQKKWLSLIF